MDKQWYRKSIKDLVEEVKGVGYFKLIFALEILQEEQQEGKKHQGRINIIKKEMERRSKK